MKYVLTLTMIYKGLGSNPDGSVTKVVDCSMNNVKFSVVSDNSRPSRVSSGNIIVTKEYDGFGLFLNNTSDYFIAPDSYTYTLIQNGISIDTNKIQLINNNIETNSLTFKLYDDIVNAYQNIYDDWDTDHNIIGNVSTGGNTVTYADIRTINTKNTVIVGGWGSQEELNAFIDLIIVTDDEWIPVEVNFTYVTVAVWNISIDWEQLTAKGYYNGSEKEPPAGVEWVYSTDSGGYPIYIKKPAFVSVEYPTFIDTSSAINTCYIVTEDITQENYVGVAMSLNDIIEYLIGKADSSIAFDSNSFTDFYDVRGKSYHGGANEYKPFARIKVIGLSDFIPKSDGTLETRHATKGTISYKTISDWLLSISAYWYLELIGSTYFYRLSHITKKTLAAGNPELTNYFNKDQTFFTRNIEILEAEFDKLTNSSQSSGIDFVWPEYKYRNGTKTKGYSSNNILTDLHYIVDAKTKVFDKTDTTQWVFCSTIKEISGGKFLIRSVTSDLTGIITSNFEISFYYMSLTYMEMPGKISIDNTVFDDNRIAKLQEITLSLPITSSIFNFLDFFGYILYFEKEAEISSITHDAPKNECKLKIKLLHL